MPQAVNTTQAPGREIRETREQYGITAKDLAAEAGVSRDTLAAYETGMLRGRPYRRRPNRTTADAIERALTHLVDAVCRQKRS